MAEKGSQHKKTKRNKRIKLIIGGIVSVLVCIAVFCVFSIKKTLWIDHYVWKSRMFFHFFVDGDNKFNWIGITSIIAVITLGINAWDHRRQFKADLISKSRIDWIQNVREDYGKMVEALLHSNADTPNKGIGSIVVLKLYYNADFDDEVDKANEISNIESSTFEKKLDNKDNNDIKNAYILRYLVLLEEFYKDEFFPKFSKKYTNVKFAEKMNYKNKNYEAAHAAFATGKTVGAQFKTEPFTKKFNFAGYTIIDETVLPLSNLIKLTNYLDNLTKWINLYLKIEWERAKSGD